VLASFAAGRKVKTRSAGSLDLSGTFLYYDNSIGCKSTAVLRRDLIAALPQETRDYCRGLLI